MSSSSYPAHASPALPPLTSPRPTEDSHAHTPPTFSLSTQQTSNPPLVTPRFTPPHTPTGSGPSAADSSSSSSSSSIGGDPTSTTTNHSALAPLPPLPEVWCQVRARIPTTTGQEMFLHLYHNSADSKEHLAIVFGPHIRSRSLDEVRPGESERDRMIRGAYVGRLFPGRTSSKGVERGGVEVQGNGAEIGVGAGGAGVQELGPALVRIHSECYTGETVWSARCDCGEQLDEAARQMSELDTDPSHATPSVSNGSTPHPQPHEPDTPPTSLGGVIVYLRQEGRGIGLLSKLKAYNLQDLGADTLQANLLLRHPADARSYGLATAMLLDLGLGGEQGIRLLTNNPDKVRAVEGPNREVRVAQRVPMIPIAWKSGGKEGVRGEEVDRYISTKIEKFKHMFTE